MIHPWQSDKWQQLATQIVATGAAARLPHALMLHGAQGIGKLDFARHLANALLCENLRTDAQPCGVCGACRWFGEGNHPDFRVLVPEALRKSLGFSVTAAEEEGDAKPAAEAADGEAGTKKKALSKEIRIEEVRQIGPLMNVSTHRGTRRVVLVVPAEAINVAASNALLKMLEEPPANTHFILVTHKIDRILPTIKSRCALLAFGKPPQDQALAWLSEQKISNPAAVLSACGGRPLLALQVAQNSSTAARALTDALAQSAGAGGRMDPIALAEALAKLVDGKAADKGDDAPKQGLPDLVNALMRWVTDLILSAQTGTVRYHPEHGRVIERFARTLSIVDLHRALRDLGGKQRIANHPLNARLFLEDVLISYARLHVRV